METITKDSIKDLLYSTYNEFDNEIGDYSSKYKKNLTPKDIKIMFEFLENYINKVELVLEDTTL